MKKNGLSLVETLITSSLLIMILAMFLMLFRGLNNESRIAEAYSDIVTNTSRAADNIKASYLTLEYIFPKSSIDQIINRFQGLNMFNGTSFPNIMSNIENFNQLNFPNNNVGNAIAFMSFEGITVMQNNNTPIAIPKYKIKIIHLQQTTLFFRSLQNRNTLNLSLSETQFLYSLENLKNITIDQQLSQRINNYIFFDKEEVNNMDRFFKKLNNNGFIDYTGPIPIESVKFLLKNESYQGIVYSIAYNRNVFDNINVPVRISAWAQENNNFPAGLEIIVLGTKTSRKIYTRLVTVADMSKRNLKFHTITITSNVSEKF